MQKHYSKEITGMYVGYNSNLIECWIYVVSKLDFSNWSRPGNSQANCKAKNALLAQRCVKNTFIPCTKQSNEPNPSFTTSAYSCPLLWQVILTHKVGHTDLVYSVWSGFTSRSVQARLQVSVKQLQFVPPWLTSRHTHRQHLTSLGPTWKAQPAELTNLVLWQLTMKPR